MPRSRRLTPRQRLVLDTIRQRLKLTGRPPTLRELGEALGIASTNGVRDHLKALEDKGYVRRDGHAARGIQLVNAKLQNELPDLRDSASSANGANLPNNLQVPVLGRVAAGLPILAEQNLEGHLSLDSVLVRDGDVFALRVKGDSMRDAGILDGDYVFVRQQPTAQPRDIVVALLDEETTVKRYVPTGDTVRLEPENPDFSPIVVQNAAGRLSILGKVCAVLRTI
jgi:repressor LexA